VPAAACGLVGLKPGRGAIPQGPGYNNLLGGLATELVVSRSVRDTALAWKIANQREAVVALPVRPYRIGLLQAAPQGVPLNAEWAAAASSAANILAQAGHNVQVLDARRLEQACALSEQAFQTYACRGAAAAALALNPDEQGFEAMTWAAARHGQTLSALDHIDAEIAMAKADALMHALFREFDVILSPALAQPIHKIGALPTGGKDLGNDAVQAHFAKFTALAPFAVIANAAGCPAMVLPHGLDQRGMPLAVQLMSKNGTETMLIALALELEAAAPWPLLAPLAYEAYE
jgi:amidase